MYRGSLPNGQLVAVKILNPSVPSIRFITTPVEVQVFTYRQLRLATSNFSSANVIGNGGFGLVYRSVLLDGRVTAIKEIDRDGKQGEREFRVKVDLLSRLHPPYLLQLVGYCADQDHRLLVYEYMPNGNLQEHLYSNVSPRFCLQISFVISQLITEATIYLFSVGSRYGWELHDSVTSA